jgi:ubiquinone/menaquinone biosynthesis C-methylase UbiE
MELESRVLEMLQQIGVMKDQTVLDFGCGYGAYTVPAAKIVGEQGRVYALDKDREALEELMQKAESAGLKNIERMDTSGELDIDLTDESIDVVLLFDVFHSFYFPQAADRRRLLGEIYRVMKPSGSLNVSVWPNLAEPETGNEIENANLRLGKEVPETLTDGNKDLATRRVLSFRKAQYVSALTNQSKRRQHEQDSGNHGSKF